MNDQQPPPLPDGWVELSRKVFDGHVQVHCACKNNLGWSVGWCIWLEHESQWTHVTDWSFDMTADEIRALAAVVEAAQ